MEYMTEQGIKLKRVYERMYIVFPAMGGFLSVIGVMLLLGWIVAMVKLGQDVSWMNFVGTVVLGVGVSMIIVGFSCKPFVYDYAKRAFVLHQLRNQHLLEDAQLRFFNSKVHPMKFSDVATYLLSQGICAEEQLTALVEKYRSLDGSQKYFYERLAKVG